MNLFNHQQQLVKRNPDRHALIWETGTGKTFGTLSLAIRKSKIILIICPKGLVDKWNEDIKNFPGPTYKVISKEQFKKFHKTLPWFECAIVDESHYFFGTKSGLMKSLKWYFENHKVKYRFLLTGTPYRSTPMDIYMMCYLLGNKLNYWSFQNEFFYSVRMGTRMIPMVKKGIEQKIKNPKALELIFQEMTFNVVYSMYPVTFEEAAALAAIHLFIEKGANPDKSAIVAITTSMGQLHYTLWKSVRTGRPNSSRAELRSVLTTCVDRRAELVLFP